MDAAAPASVQNDALDSRKEEDNGNEQPLSRKQQKKLAKLEWIKERNAARKAAERERKTAEREKRDAEAKARFEAMTDEERARRDARRAVIREGAAEERRRARERTRAALDAPLKIVIDLDMDGLMLPSELRSLISQVNFSYGAATKGDKQAHLHLLGYRGAVEEQLKRQMPHLDAWAVTASPARFADYFGGDGGGSGDEGGGGEGDAGGSGGGGGAQNGSSSGGGKAGGKGGLERLVYLTADSPNELAAVDTSKVYIIGGVVDRNRHKRLCLQRAEAAGVAHARLPIQKHVTLSTSAVLTVNQVVDILVRGQGSATDWAAVLAAALPTRKQHDGGGGAGGGGGSGGGGPTADDEVKAAEAYFSGGGGAEEEGQAAAAKDGGGSGGEGGAGEPDPKRAKLQE